MNAALQIWNWLRGKKSYIAALGLFFYGVYDIADGNMSEGWHKIMEAGAVFGIRNAI